jgi:ribonuclease R
MERVVSESSKLPSKKEILEIFSRTPGKNFTASQLRGALNISRGNKQNFKKRLKSLVKDKFLKMDKRKRYTPTALVKGGEAPKESSKASSKEMVQRRDRSDDTPDKRSDSIKGQLVRIRDQWWAEAFKPHHGKWRVAGRLRDAEVGQRVLFKVLPARYAGDEEKAKVFSTFSTGEKWDDISREFLKKNHLTSNFGLAIDKQVAKYTELDKSEFAKRVDYRNLHTVCIDPIGARDHDDALSLEILENGGWRLGVHIADVSHYVTDGSPLDKEALFRSYTQYLPWMAVPMLPESLSTDMCSLKEGKDRFAFSCIVELSPRGIVKDFKFEKTIVNVDSFVTYEEAMERFEKGDQEFVNLRKLTRYLNGRRKKDGILLMNMPETKVQFDENGEPKSIDKKGYLESQNWIEECMLLANQCCAKWLGKNKLQGVYRVHEAPPWKSISELLQAEPHLMGGQAVDYDSIEAETPGKNVNAKKFELYQTMVQMGAGDLPMMRKILRSMTKAKYSELGDGHFALNWSDYAHFTSPIRRYADLYVHRRMTQFLGGNKEGNLLEGAHKIAEQISEKEITIMKCERSAFKVCSAWLVKDHIGETFEGVISGMEEFGMFVEIPSLSSEGLVKYKDIPGDFYIFNPDKRVAYGRKSRRVYEIGDKVQVQIIRVQVLRGEVDLSVVVPTK